jgi:hypothetical protein
VRFALAHMSCGGSWCWHGVAALLPDVHAPDLDFTPGATPADHAVQLGDGDVVVGHSYGSLPERRVFVHCLQSDFAAQAQRARQRGFEIVEVDAGHLWPLEQPEACVALLLEAAAGD